jgi:hypothetical protein
LVLAQDLVERRPLLMAQAAELACLVHDLRVRRDRFLFGRFQILAEIDDQRRNVVEQAVARKDLVGLDRQQIVEPREPSRGERGVIGRHPFGDGVGKSGGDHGDWIIGPDCS